MISKNKTKNNNTYGLSNIINKKNMNKYFRNNTDLLKSIFSFVIAIGLIIVLYNVYKYYKEINNIEGFENQEPYDLLDKIKSNIYRLDTIWNNQLYNFQPGLKEDPCAFWVITKQDSAYKIIGHAVNNKVEELQDNLPIAPKDKTMLVDGDTKPPVDVKLLYTKKDNLITKKIKNNTDNDVYNIEYINIKTIEDINDRLEIVKNLYDLLVKTKNNIMSTIDKTLNYEFDNLSLKTYLYSFNNFFKNPNFILSSKLGVLSKSLDGKFNCVRIPLGANVIFTFNNGSSINFNHDYNSILNSNKSEYIKLDNENIFKEQNGNMFKYSMFFDIFGEFGLNKNNEKIIKQYKGKISPNKSRTINFPYNYSISNNTKNGTGSNKVGLYDYINEKINNSDLRKKTIMGNNQPYTNILIANNSVDEKDEKVKTAYITSSAIGSKFDYNYHTISNKIILNNRDKIISVDINDKNTTIVNEENFENFDNLINNQLYKIPNSRIHVENTSIDFSININDNLEEADKEFNKHIDKEWFKGILNKINETNPDKLISNLIKFTDVDFMIFDNNELKITYPSFYLDFTFNYPNNILNWDRRNNCANGKQALSTCYKSKEGNTAFIKNSTIDNIPLHNNLEWNSEFYLKNISVKSNYTKFDHPLYKSLNNFKNNIKSEFDNLINYVIDSSNKLNNLRDKILSNNYQHYPMKIYRPIPPKYYKSVGDLIYAQTSTFRDDENYEANKPNISQIACIPEQCVREVREWLPVDKIYEYQKDGDYLAIFKNPYLQTFRAVTTPGILPPGKVEKIVACVERCKLVDDIIQADKCSKTFYKTHKNITDTFNMDPDNVINERKNQIYKNKIVERQDRLNVLNETARRLQVQDDKANLVNEAYNRNKLQDLVDKQNANMHKLVDKLENGRNKIAVRVKFNYDKLFKLCSSGDLPDNVCRFVQNNIRKPSSTLTDAERRQYDTNALNALLDSCPTPESEGLVSRTLVENNCGCYFTDEELNTTN